MLRPTRRREPVAFTVPARTVVLLLGSIAVVLLLLSLGLQGVANATGSEGWIFGAVDVNQERSLPTFYSAGILFLASLILFVIASAAHQSRDPFRTKWFVLSIGFFMMMLDEVLSFHERLGAPTARLLGGDLPSVLYFTWVVPAILLVIVVGAYMLKFVRGLPSRIRMIFLIAGAVYVGGSVGLEIVGGWWLAQGQADSFGSVLLAHLEEAGEMAGVIVFIWGLFLYMAAEHKEIRVKFEESSS